MRANSTAATRRRGSQLLCHSPCLIYNNGRSAAAAATASAAVAAALLLVLPSVRSFSSSSSFAPSLTHAAPCGWSLARPLSPLREHNERGHHFKAPRLSKGPLASRATLAGWLAGQPPGHLARSLTRHRRPFVACWTSTSRVSALPSGYGLLACRRRRRR